MHLQQNWTPWVQQTVIRWCWLCSVAEWTDRCTEPTWSFKPTSLLTAAAGKWSPMSRFSNWSNSSRDAGKDSSGTRYRRSFCSVHSRNRYFYSGKLRNTLIYVFKLQYLLLRPWEIFYRINFNLHKIKEKTKDEFLLILFLHTEYFCKLQHELLWRGWRQNPEWWENTEMLEDDVIYSLWHLLSYFIDLWSVIFVVWSSGLSFVEDTGEDNCYVNAESGSESD